MDFTKDNEFLKPATDVYRNRLIEEQKLGWTTLIIGIVLYIAWVIFTQPSISLAILGLAVMWIMRLLNEMRKIQHINAATVEYVIAQNNMTLRILAENSIPK
jgi:uncharacterized membrane protein YesL